MILSAVLNHIWQSTLFAIAVGFLTLAFRQAAARVRYWLWLAASLKFLIPFALLVGAGSSIGWRTVPVERNLSSAMKEVSRPFTVATPLISNSLPPRSPSQLPVCVLVAIWLCGFGCISALWSVRWLRLQAEIRAASPLQPRAGIRTVSSPTLREPGIFGILRPVLMLPKGIAEQLTPAEMRAILTHELCHIRNRDNLTAALHMCVEAIFWFHPLVWWIGARLVEERERACDEEVLSLGGQPQTYAEGILKTCKFYLASPLACASGVSGSDLTQRITRIMTNRAAVTLGFGRKLLLVSAAAASLIGPLTFGLLSASPIAVLAAAPNRLVLFDQAEKATSGAPNSTPVALKNPSGFVGPKAVQQIMPRTRDLPPGAVTKPIILSVQVHIDALGRVTSSKLISYNENTAVTAAVLSAAKRWKFQPATLHGQPVESDHYLVFPLAPKDYDYAPLAETPSSTNVEAPPSRTIVDSGPNSGPPAGEEGGTNVELRLLDRPAFHLSELPEGSVSKSMHFRIEARIGKDGHISSANPIDFDPQSTVGAAVLANVKKWIYQPAIFNGQPVEVTQIVVFKIDLPNTSASKIPENDIFVAPRPLLQVMPNTRNFPEGLISATLRLEVEARVDSSGSVASVNVKDFDPQSLVAQSALAAAKQWKFQPATLNGQPVESNHSIVFEFRPEK